MPVVEILCAATCKQMNPRQLPQSSPQSTDDNDRQQRRGERDIKAPSFDEIDGTQYVWARIRVDTSQYPRCPLPQQSA